MEKIYLQEKIAAIIHRSNGWNKGLDFITANEDFIQVGTWWYDENKVLKSHRHIENKREVLKTQETIVIIQGKLELVLYDDDNKIFNSVILEKGDMGIILNGGHGYKILEEDTKVIEIKNGPFISVEKDKELI